MDVPVKHYSSGMYARLAFSVSIHIDPDILLVDEVLAVGDQSFQQKCLDRIATLKRAGVSLCFVSHSLETARAVCTRGLWIERGQLRADGPIDEVAEAYLDWVANRLPASVTATAGSDLRHGNRKVEVTRVALLDGQGAECQTFHTGQPLRVAIEYRVNSPVADMIVGLGVHRLDGVHVTGPNTSTTPLHLPAPSGHGVVLFTVPALPLLEGHYQVSIALHNRADTEFYDYFDRAFGFQVSNSQGEFPERYGLLTLGGEWHHTSA
jgi:lipopolysaccharide transport system ATP-binding protein